LRWKPTLFGKPRDRGSDVRIGVQHAFGLCTGLDAVDDFGPVPLCHSEFLVSSSCVSGFGRVPAQVMAECTTVLMWGRNVSRGATIHRRYPVFSSQGEGRTISPPSGTIVAVARSSAVMTQP
jgi:hypothetical protein